MCAHLLNRSHTHAGIATFNPDKICVNHSCSVYHWSLVCACVQLMSLIWYLVFDVYTLNPAESVRFYNRDMHLQDIMLQMSVAWAFTNHAPRHTFSLSLFCPLRVYVCFTNTHIQKGRSQITFLPIWIISPLILCLWRPSTPTHWPDLARYPAVSACGWAWGLSCAASPGLNSCTLTLTTRSMLPAASFAFLHAVN